MALEAWEHGIEVRCIQNWELDENPGWVKSIAYRRRPKPQKHLVPWQLGDIEPGIAVYKKDEDKNKWKLIQAVDAQRVTIDHHSAFWSTILSDYLQYPSGDPCGKEVEDDWTKNNVLSGNLVKDDSD